MCDGEELTTHYNFQSSLKNSVQHMKEASWGVHVKNISIVQDREESDNNNKHR